MTESKPMWEPSRERREGSEMARFQALASTAAGRTFETYEDLWRWSVSDVAGFWSLFWDFASPLHSGSAEASLVDGDKMPGARWFPGVQLNFAENLLRFDDDNTAIVFHPESGEVRRLSYAELRRQVARAARGLKTLGVSRGDTVAGFMPNMPETIVAMLATASLGATWTSCSPDFGLDGVLDRFGQIEPKVLFAADGYAYSGKTFDCLDRVAAIESELGERLSVVVVPFASETPDLTGLTNARTLEDLLGADDGPELEFEQVPFDHPLYVMYSSGTTGLPKCMVQSVGGILLNHLKEHRLHCDLRREDSLFYFTTCGWMMWNWLVTGLATGATIVLSEGSPFHPDPLALWRLIEQEKITIFGTSAKYIAALEKAGAKPGRDCDLSSLRTVLSTGSPLAPESFDYVYRDVKEDVQLSSISGGTDLNGCFALGNPVLPVHSGELQCRGLGMDVAAWSEGGEELVDEQGELVCKQPFPSMPLRFWNDADGTKYHEAYFSRFPGVWHHGDFIEVTSRGTVVISGRSDATLNPGGVRIGTSDIYRIVEQVPEVADSIVIGQEWDGDVRVVLFVKMAADSELDEAFVGSLKKTIRQAASPRHVPAKVLAVSDIPYTRSGKKVELAVRKLVMGQEITNREAIANPECLKDYEGRAELAE